MTQKSTIRLTMELSFLLVCTSGYTLVRCCYTLHVRWLTVTSASTRYIFLKAQYSTNSIQRPGSLLKPFGLVAKEMYTLATLDEEHSTQQFCDKCTRAHALVCQTEVQALEVNDLRVHVICLLRYSAAHPFVHSTWRCTARPESSTWPYSEQGPSNLH